MIRKGPTFLHLPQTLLNHEITKFLSNDSVHVLNEALPKPFRIIRKMKKEFIEQHHKDLLIEKFMGMMERCIPHESILKKCVSDYEKQQYDQKRYLGMYKFIQELKKPYSLLIFSHEAFKLKVIDKLIEFQTLTPGIKIPISFKWYNMMKRLCRKTTQHILSL